MDTVSGIVVVLLVLLSGAVAAIGDWLGRKLGKKRLKWGRLRPKHTAIVTTFIAGMLITLITIVILSLMSEQVRKWLIEGANVQQQLKNAQDDLADAQSERRQGLQDIAKVRDELKTESAKLAEEQRKVEQATREAGEMRAEATQLRSQVASLKADVEASKASLSKLQAQYADVEKELAQKQDNIAEFVRQQGELVTQNNKLLEENDNLESDLAKLQKQIDDLNKAIAEAKKEQEITNSNFAVEKANIEKQRMQALADLTEAKTELSNVQRDLSMVQAIALNLRDDNTRSRLSPLIYNRGDELARLPVRSMLSQAEARNYLLQAIELASRDARPRGAVEAPTSNITAAFATLRGQDNSPITPEAQAQRAIDQMAAKATEMLIIVRSLFNSFKGDWVAIDVQVVPNPVVYHQDDFIAETRIDGKLGIQGVTDALLGFMRQQLRDRVIRDGLIPAVGRETEIGEVTQERIQQLVGDIVEAQRPITVRFHADRDTRAGDTLSLDIRLR